MKFSKMKTMSPIKLFADLMTSKYFLWFIALLSSINIVGYISMGYIDAVVLFALVSFITFVFSKNMTVVLLVAVVTVNLYIQTGGATEGFQEGAGNNQGGRGGSSKSIGDPSLSNKDNLTNMEDADPEDGIEPDQPTTTTETTETTVIPVVEEEEEEEEDKEAFDADTTPEPNKKTKPKPAVVKQHNYIDYATTLSDAYKNLETMIGEGGLQNLTDDTKKLMDQQSKLFSSMDKMGPLLLQAQTMMKDFDMSAVGVGGKGTKLAEDSAKIGKSAAK